MGAFCASRGPVKKTHAIRASVRTMSSENLFISQPPSSNCLAASQSLGHRAAQLIDRTCQVHSPIRFYQHTRYAMSHVKGEVYPCELDIFAATYEAAESPAMRASSRDYLGPAGCTS